MSPPPDGAPRIELRGLKKRYGSTIALDGVDLDLEPGEVLGVAGPNGAGKSTLVRILAGEEQADAGELRFGGAPWSPVADWMQVAVVHQEPQLFPNLSVGENVLAGREGTKLARPRLGADDLRLMEALGIGHLASMPLEDCTLATQQRTEIARALARNARVFLFDEPNSALTDEESDELFSEMHKIAASGCIVILVTHRLSDLVEHAGRVAVIRDGKVRALLGRAGLTQEAIAEQLVLGSTREAGAEETRAAAIAGDALLATRQWSHASEFHEVNLAVGRGEVLALIGVEGSGARELLRSLAGLERCSGTIAINGMSGDAAIRRQTAYVPAARQVSLYSNLSVGENLLVRLENSEIGGFALALRKGRMRALAEAAIRRFQVKAQAISQPIRSLSGGNQQKVAIAQALASGPSLLLLEEPTRGVDVGSKREIYRILRRFAAAGNAVVMFCTEVLEVFETADRAIVVSDGELSNPLTVAGYPHVEALAGDVARLERHSRVPAGAV